MVFGYIYLIEERGSRGPTGYYKVGITKNKKKRIRGLQTGNARQLVMIHCTKRQLKEEREKEVHDEFKKLFEHCHDTEGGGREWYYTTEDPGDMIKCFDKSVGVQTKTVNISNKARM
jgi:hypothetical protein